MKSNKLLYSFAVCGLLLSAQGYSLGGGDNGPVINQIRPNPNMAPTQHPQRPAAKPTAPADQSNARRMGGEDGATPAPAPSDVQDSHGKGSSY